MKLGSSYVPATLCTCDIDLCNGESRVRVEDGQFMAYRSGEYRVVVEVVLLFVMITLGLMF